MSQLLGALVRRGSLLRARSFLVSNGSRAGLTPSTELLYGHTHSAASEPRREGLQQVGTARGFAEEPSALDLAKLSWGYGEAVPYHRDTPTQRACKNPTNKIQYVEFNHERFPPGSPSKKAFTYMVVTGGRFIYASALRLLLLKFVLSMSATKDVLAMASLEVDLSNVEPGSTITVKWRGKPVFIRRRTPSDIAKANDVDLLKLRDPEEDSRRAPNPEWLVVIGVCTHLGCVPLPNAGDYGVWFCPCHGSHYDISGRIRKGPAPLNLEVPHYKFLDDTKLLVG